MMTASDGLIEAFNSPARGTMHLIVRSLVASVLATAALGQSHPAESANKILISKLVIESNSLPGPDREQIVHSFQQKSYFQLEIGERIRQAFRDIGYFKAVVDEPKFSFPPQAEKRTIANVTVTVEPGTQYRLGEIRFEKATVFPSAQLRDLFPVSTGELFNTTKFVRGLENIRELYGTKGYVNFVASPEAIFEESRRTINFVLFVDEGKPYNFGQLLLEGVEPHAGAANALVDSWKPLVGHRYNSLELHQWLLAHHADWKAGVDSVETTIDPESLAVNVKLTQWPN
jgi:hypothetical protein